MREDAHYDLARRYFEYLAERFPVMCASDEFHFLPRAQGAVNHYDRLDNFAAEALEHVISDLKGFQKAFGQSADGEKDSEKRIDLELLGANAAGILIALEKHQIWRNNPLLYLKIAFIGLDHALTKPVSESGERGERIFARLSAIPGLLNQGIENILGVPETYHAAARAMLKDCREYLLFEIQNCPELCGDRWDAAVGNVQVSLNAFDGFLKRVSPVPDKRFAADSLEDSLKNHFRYTRSLDDIFQIAREEWQSNLEQLEKIRLEIDPKQTWQTLYHSCFPENVTQADTFDFYREEIDRLCLFFDDIGLSQRDICRSMELKETPVYLRSVRSAASFGASLTAARNEKSFFYITTHRFGKTAEDLLKKRFHREYKYLIAHETVPGHHMLDSIRRRLKNPVRRQVESPLFYEGWATYAESLLIEYGYIRSPMEYLTHYKRSLWRAARCQIDVGLSRRLLTNDDALTLLIASGFSEDEAKRQIARFSLNPGYQLCYSLGNYEFKKLKERFGHRMPRNAFYKELLAGGELPFHLIRKRFEDLTRAEADQ